MDEQIEKGSGNVYADLGFLNSEEMISKSQLVGRIAQTIKDEGLTQRAAAERIGISQPELARLLLGHFHGTSESKILEFVNRLTTSLP